MSKRAVLVNKGKMLPGSVPNKSAMTRDIPVKGNNANDTKSKQRNSLI